MNVALNDELWLAVEQNQLSKVESLLQRGAHPLATHHTHANILARAVKLNREELVSALVSAIPHYRSLHPDCDVDAVDTRGRTALHYAAENARPVIVQLLITVGSNVNIVDSEGVSPLHLACSSGSVSVVWALISAGAQLNQTAAACYGSVTPLHVSVARSYPAVVGALLEAGASPDTCDQKGQTALFAAVNKNNVQIAQLLLAYGANPNLASSCALAEAVHQNNAEMVDLLLSNNGRSNFSEYLLHRAIPKSEAIALSLISHGYSPSLRDSSGWTPLHVACKVGSLNVVRALVQTGSPDPNDMSAQHGHTPLMCFVRWMNDEDCGILNRIIRILEPAGLDLNRYSTRLGNTALSLSALLNKPKMFRLFIAAGADAYAGRMCVVRALEQVETLQSELMLLLCAAGFRLDGMKNEVASLGDATRRCVRETLFRGKSQSILDLVDALPLPPNLRAHLIFYV